MKKLISFLLSATLLAATFATTVMAETATATVAMYLQSADYNTNQAVLALTLEGVEAYSYTYLY